MDTPSTPRCATRIGRVGTRQPFIFDSSPHRDPRTCPTRVPTRYAFGPGSHSSNQGVDPRHDPTEPQNFLTRKRARPSAHPNFCDVNDSLTLLATLRSASSGGRPPRRRRRARPHTTADQRGSTPTCFGEPFVLERRHVSLKYRTDSHAARSDRMVPLAPWPLAIWGQVSNLMGDCFDAVPLLSLARHAHEFSRTLFEGLPM
jgi:hypothetical protein